MAKEPPKPTIRSDYYYIVETTTWCVHCRKQINVIAFLVPPGHAQAEPLDGDPDEFASKEEYQAWLDGPDSWAWRKDLGFAAMLFEVEYLSASVVTQLREHTGPEMFRRNKSLYLGRQTWMNHCPHCHWKQGDHILHDSSGSAFCAQTYDEVERFEFTRIDEPFAADATYHTDGWFPEEL
jgi:hypothetical protein